MVKVGEYEAKSFKMKDRIGSLVVTLIGILIVSLPQLLNFALNYIEPGSTYAIIINIVGIIVTAGGVQGLGEVRIPAAEKLAVFNYVRGNEDRLPDTIPEEIWNMSPNVDETGTVEISEDEANPEETA